MRVRLATATSYQLASVRRGIGVQRELLMRKHSRAGREALMQNWEQLADGARREKEEHRRCVAQIERLGVAALDPHPIAES